jgi:hypothetical protein
VEPRIVCILGNGSNRIIRFVQVTNASHSLKLKYFKEFAVSFRKVFSPIVCSGIVVVTPIGVAFKMSESKVTSAGIISDFNRRMTEVLRSKGNEYGQVAIRKFKIGV